MCLFKFKQFSNLFIIIYYRIEQIESINIAHFHSFSFISDHCNSHILFRARSNYLIISNHPYDYAAEHNFLFFYIPRTFSVIRNLKKPKPISTFDNIMA